MPLVAALTELGAHPNTPVVVRPFAPVTSSTSLDARSAARPAARSLAESGGKLADREKGTDMNVQQYDGDALAGEVFDLIQRRLPLVPGDDPVHGVLAKVLPVLGDALGRPREELAAPPRATR